MKEQMIKLIDQEIENLHQEMKHLDLQYIKRQKKVRQLRRDKLRILESQNRNE